MLVGILSLGLTGNAIAGLNDGLIAFYPFNGNANDESGNGNNGAVTGAILADDRLGNPNSAYSFDGDNDHITSIPPLPTGAQPRSVTAWFNTTSTSGDTGWFHNTIVNWGEASTNNAFGLSVYLGELKFGAYGSNDVLTGQIVSDGSCHHVGVTYDGSMLKVFLDGVEVSQASMTLATMSSNLYIGKRSTEVDQNMNGTIDNVRIYNRALSTLEIQGLYKGEVSCMEKNVGAVLPNLDVHIPALQYESVVGPQNIWVDFEYLGTNLEGRPIWGLKGFGENQ